MTDVLRQAASSLLAIIMSLQATLAGVPGNSNSAAVESPGAGSSAVQATAANLLFKSGFEDNTTLAPLAGYSGMVQNFSGTDQASGFNWPLSVWNPSWGGLQVIGGTGNPEPMTSYFGNTIDSSMAYSGSRSLLLRINKSAPQTRADQVAFEYVGFSEPVTDYYLRARARFNPEFLSQVQTVKGQFWRMLWEMKTSNDYRNKVEIYGSSSGVPYWHVSADNNPNNTYPPCPAGACWSESNTTVPVPLDQWFTYEVYLKRSTGSDGRFAFAVNGQMVTDHYGPNYGAYNEKVHVFMHTNLYGPFDEQPAMLPAYQWLDDVEIYDAPPCAAMPCGTTPVSSPDTGTPPGDSWVLCAKEYQTCSYTGVKEVRYGANGIYVYKTLTGPVSCVNGTFGADPLPNVFKSCSYKSTDIQNPPPAVPPSTKFTPGQKIQTVSSVNVRSGSSVSDLLLGTQSQGSLGTVVGGGENVGGYYWWNVNYDNMPDGYSVEDYLLPYTAPTLTNKFQLNDRIRTTTKLKVRQTPTSSGKALCTQPKGALGSITGGPQAAGGYIWWQVDYDSSCDGWSVQDWLTK